MFWRWLEHVRRQPRPYRARIALAGAVTITSVIAAFWMVSLPERFAAIGQVVAEPAPVERGLFSNLFAGVRSQTAAVRDSLSALQAQVTSDTTATSATSTGTAATSTKPARATTTTPNAAIVLPKLNPAVPQPRPIQIATTSAEAP